MVQSGTVSFLGVFLNAFQFYEASESYGYLFKKIRLLKSVEGFRA